MVIWFILTGDLSRLDSYWADCSEGVGGGAWLFIQRTLMKWNGVIFSLAPRACRYDERGVEARRKRRRGGDL